ncbi:MAG: hypothetical protein Q8R72_06430 [Hylemonella sp.]|nr:hypothetical protein [Hylemonella sp.]
MNSISLGHKPRKITAPQSLQAPRLLGPLQERLRYLRDRLNPKIYSHLLKVAAGGTISPLDAMMRA